jgi:hypothetical protein
MVHSWQRPNTTASIFALSELLELVKDRAWMVKVANVVNQH